MTTYNGELYIEAQLTSILNQTRPVDQVLICDDGSVDTTVQIIRRFIYENQLDHWSLSLNKETLGPAKNVLTHLALLEGDLVFLADQDDVWEPRKVELLATYMYSDDALALVVSRTSLIDKYGDPLVDRSIRRRVGGVSVSDPSRARRAESLGFDDFIGTSTIPLHAMCVRGQLARQVGSCSRFPELSRSLGADWYIGMWSTLMGRAVLVPETLVRRRVHSANISLGRLRKQTVLSATPDKRLQMLREAREAHLSLLDETSIRVHLKPRQEQLIHRILAHLGRRIELAEAPNLFRAACLLTQLELYVRCANGLARGVRTWVADVMYAHNLNWRLRRRVGHDRNR